MSNIEKQIREQRLLLDSELPEIPGAAFRARIRRAWGYLDRLLALLGEPLTKAQPAAQHLQREELVEIEQWLAKAWKECGPSEDALHRLEDGFRELSHLEDSLDDFSAFVDAAAADSARFVRELLPIFD